MKTIKKLLIKNENDYSWDANAKVVELLTKRGGQLQELAISFGLRPFVSFLLTKLHSVNMGSYSSLATIPLDFGIRADNYLAYSASKFLWVIKPSSPTYSSFPYR